MAEKVTIMNVVHKGAVAELLQGAIEEADDMEGCVISYIKKDGEPVVVWAGIRDLTAIGLMHLCKALIMSHMKRKEECDEE